MRLHLAPAATAAALAATAVPAEAQRRPAATPACPEVTEADVKRQFDRFNQAWSTLNPDAVTTLFAPKRCL
mgnify:CR=1 FL=1